MTFERVEIGNAVLYLGDCLEVLPVVPDVDAVVSDPPYGVQFKGSSTKHSTRDGIGYASFEDTPEMISTVCVPAIRMAVSKARSAIITPGSACCHLYDVPLAMGAIFYPSGANSGPWGFICSQPLYYYGKDPFLARGMGSRPNGFSTTESAKPNGHPCPKPIGQTKWMIDRVSFVGETILDPFMGSGTTGVAAIEMGRKFFGIEIEPQYFEIACKRIAHAVEQSKQRLFEPEPEPQPNQPDLGLEAAG